MTEGTSLSARQSLYALGPYHEIDILDPAALCQGRFSRFVRRWFRCPNFAKEPKQFLQFLVEHLQKEQYDVLLPTHEQVYLLSKYRESFSKRIGLALPEFSALQRLQDKAQFMRLLDELGLPHPETSYITTRDELERASTFPCYIKLAHSTAGCGVHLVEEESQLTGIADRMQREGLLDGHCESLIQQPAKGVQATVQAVFQHGRMVGAHCFEARDIGVGGMSSARVSADHQIVLEQVAKMGTHLSWHGSTFIDYFFDNETGQPEYIEANPRIGETVSALLGGINLCDLLVRVSLDEQLETVEPVCATTAGIRTDSFMMIMISRALEGSGRCRLLSEVMKKACRRGLYRNSHDELTRPRDDYLSILPLVWICAQLLAFPGISKSIVAKTIDNYSLPESAIHRIHELPDDLVEQMLANG